MEKNILLQIMEHLPAVTKSDSKEQRNMTQYVFSEIFSYNKRFPTEKIVISKNENLLKSLREILEGNTFDYEFRVRIKEEVCKLHRNDFENEVLKYYFEKILPNSFEDWVPLWYLKHDPLVIVENLENVMKARPTATFKIWSRIRSYSHLDLDNMVKGYCLNQLNRKENMNEIKFIRPLSFLCSAEEYIEIMKESNLIPTSSKLIVENNEVLDIYNLQKAFATNFKNIEDISKNLDVLIYKFCKGHHLFIVRRHQISMSSIVRTTQ
ncbi:hypothetical protein NQ318_008123 [Aromia moschata]|uniref:Uncharacterized protein n=1 Tax=Aromia moschata TaxID=1265417 RepID=A0AAV8YQD3_9CUCU|nr:hypothetical protein NQ318_008123 [Aromia moschata]